MATCTPDLQQPNACLAAPEVSWIVFETHRELYQCLHDVRSGSAGRQHLPCQALGHAAEAVQLAPGLCRSTVKQALPGIQLQVKQQLSEEPASS